MIAVVLTTMLATAVAGVVLLPLFAPESAAALDRESRRMQLLAERDQLVEALRELEIDFELAKHSPESYEAEVARLEQRLSEVLDELEDPGDRDDTTP
ncbi:MAG: hypothetical protein D6761_02445 [Candidatus Dadabacteria bacterium]|nr:MAG: hypothetical protein D6761_02445 [Candidatus Dadabacteria bacterium]